MIHNDKILDQINTPGRDVLFGTSSGLSLYNGTWSTRHINRNNISEGLMDDFITSIEYDPEGNLWIGYSGGIQIYNGIYYLTLRDQQLFKDPRIQDIQRWHDDMWVATGHSGIHRFHDGTWTWYQPMSKNGPGFYEVRRIALDPVSDILVLATADNGLWTIHATPEEPAVFGQIAPRDGTYGSFLEVTRDPRGGVYLFNDTSVVHYDPSSGFSPVLTTADLTPEGIGINDIAGASDGKLYLATDDGIYIRSNGRTVKHLSRFEGIGTSEVVRTVFIDARNRVWFSTQGFVGFFLEESGSSTPITVELATTVDPDIQPPTTTPVLPPVTESSQPTDTGVRVETGGLAPILDPILKAVNAILGKLGLGTST
jgi:ligand-binding sensor domain-containing protein